jgi:hypothetical protein
MSQQDSPVQKGITINLNTPARTEDLSKLSCGQLKDYRDSAKQYADAKGAKARQLSSDAHKLDTLRRATRKFGGRDAVKLLDATITKASLEAMIANPETTISARLPTSMSDLSRGLKGNASQARRDARWANTNSRTTQRVMRNKGCE